MQIYKNNILLYHISLSMIQKRVGEGLVDEGK